MLCFLIPLPFNTGGRYLNASTMVSNERVEACMSKYQRTKPGLYTRDEPSGHVQERVGAQLTFIVAPSRLPHTAAASHSLNLFSRFTKLHQYSRHLSFVSHLLLGQLQ